MKTKTIVFLLALLLTVLAGCNNAPPNEDTPQPFSFSESVQSTSESETPAGKESKEVETTPELIRLDRYLNPKEKEIYPQWLEKQEERRAELAEEQKNREILSSAPPKQESVQAAESEPQQEAQYAYHLGDTVYMGADEYEILAFDDKRVVLHDMQYPLFQKELERDEFDRRVRENPMNDHLKVMNQAAVAEQQPRFNSIEFEKLIPHHMRFKETDLVNGNEMYWVTQEIFTAGDLRKFQQAVQSYDGDIKKFYVTPRDLSPSYSFEEDMENKVLAVITPDTILQDDYIQAVRNEGLGDYLQPEEKADSAEAPAFDIEVHIRHEHHCNGTRVYPICFGSSQAETFPVEVRVQRVNDIGCQAAV